MGGEIPPAWRRAHLCSSSLIHSLLLFAHRIQDIADGMVRITQTAANVLVCSALCQFGTHSRGARGYAHFLLHAVKHRLLVRTLFHRAARMQILCICMQHLLWFPAISR